MAEQTKPKKTTLYSVHVQATVEYIYTVEATSEDEAEESALNLFQRDEEPDHEEIVGIGHVTNIQPAEG